MTQAPGAEFHGPPVELPATSADAIGGPGDAAVLPDAASPPDGAPTGDPDPVDQAARAASRARVRRSVLIMLAVCVVVGLAQGLIWAFAAPGIPYQVLADGRYGALPTTSTYHFVGVAAFALSGIAIGIVLAVGAWQAKAVRGWQLLLALVGGSLLGALIAWAVGTWLAPGIDPASVGATDAGSIVVAPPSTGTILVVLAQPAFAAAVYTFLVAWNGHPDLGRSAAADDAHRARAAAENH